MFHTVSIAQISDPKLLKSLQEQRDSIKRMRYLQSGDTPIIPATPARVSINSNVNTQKKAQDSILKLKLKRRADSLNAISKKITVDSIAQVEKQRELDSILNIERRKAIENEITLDTESEAKAETDSITKTEAVDVTEETTKNIVPETETPKTETLIQEGVEESTPNLERATTTLQESTRVVVQDSTENDSIKSAGMLTDIVTYKAKDYMRLARKENQMYLYDEAEVIYGDMNIKAGLIIIDNTKNEIYAFGIKDSLGEYTQKPVFTQAQSVVEPDSIRFNFDTEKALVYNSRTEEGGFKVKGEITKRQNDSVYYMKNVKFTTSQDIDNPDYYFYARRIKFVPEKKIVTGLVNMYIVDVPTPLGLPFGYFPLTDKRTSGFIIPSYGEDQQRGFSLQNGGYYFAINDYVDLTATGSYFTNGSYTMQFQSTYALRYRFRGNASFRIEKLINSERGFPGFSETSNYNIQWSHSQDPKADPSSQFRASVNLGSSRFFQQSINQQNIGSNLVNNLSSSVSYSKVFQGDPEINITTAATHNQNTRSQEVNLTLPTLQAGVSRIYPFKPANGSAKGAIQNINLSYNLRGENRYSTTEEEFFTSEMFKDGIYGVQQSVPVNTNFKVLNYLSISAGGSYEENWVFRTFEQRYDEENREVVRDTINGFDSFRTYGFSTGLTTTLYGQKNFGKDKKIQAIRHVMSPNISYNINPGFSQYYDTYVIPAIDDTQEDETVSYSRFDGTLFGSPTELFSSSISFGVNNSLEAKVRDRDSTKTEPKKITLINTLSLRSSYNLTADSLKLAPVSVSGSIPIIEGLTVNFNGNLDIYALDNSNRRINTLNINNGGSLFRLTGANMSFNYSFSSKQFSDKRSDDRLDNQTLRNGGRPDDLFGKPIANNGTIYDEDEAEDEVKENTTESFNYKIPWDLRLGYNIAYANSARQDMISGHTLSISSDLELSPKWKVGGSTTFNIQEQTFAVTSFRFQRDLGSFRMSFNWQPFQTNAPWNFFIGIKSNILQDLKYEQRRRPDQTL